jgi:hypothetical protein
MSGPKEEDDDREFLKQWLKAYEGITAPESPTDWAEIRQVYFRTLALLRKDDKPEMVAYSDFPHEGLRSLCQSYIDELAKEEGYVDEDLEHYIFEAAMEACFGKDVWKWINARMK